jgi:hypothetical protein
LLAACAAGLRVGEPTTLAAGVAGFLAWFDQEYGSVDATPKNDLHPDGRPVQHDEP